MQKILVLDLSITIKFKHSYTIPGMCVLHFTELQGAFALVRYSRFEIQNLI